MACAMQSWLEWSNEINDIRLYGWLPLYLRFPQSFKSWTWIHKMDIRFLIKLYWCEWVEVVIKLTCPSLANNLWHVFILMQGYYVQLFSPHGLIRFNNPEVGRTKTRGQVKYVLELLENLSQHAHVPQSWFIHQTNHRQNGYHRNTVRRLKL